jgi:hypothetical protein
MRIAAPLALAAFMLVVACGSETTDKAAAPDEIEVKQPTGPVEALLSDDLPGLSAPSTGVAFWEHPSLPFNSLLIVSSENGVVSYNMDDGVEVGRIDGFNAQGAAVSYVGLGARAPGFVAFFDEADSLFRFYGIDNASRAFLPLNTGPSIRGAVRGFCMGRARSALTPTLFVVQNARLRLFNLTGDADGVTASGEAAIDAPDNLVSCTVDSDGVVLIADDQGAIYRLIGDNAFTAPFAQTEAETPGDLVIISSLSGEEGESISRRILLLDEADGAVHVVDAETGNALGVVQFAGTDRMQNAEPANVMGASSANLGSLYRDGILAFGAVGAEGPIVRITPASSLYNALSLSAGGAVGARGETQDGERELQISIPEFSVQPE